MSEQKNTPIHFVIPDVNAFQSGGNIYNKHLLKGLKQCSCLIKVLSITDFKALNTATLAGHYFFDTLYFTQLKNLFNRKHKDSQFFLIVHHLESLYPPKGYTQDTYFQAKELSFLTQFDGFVTSSQFTADYLTSNNLPQLKIVIPPAITYSPKSFSPKVATPINALMVANLVERKGILPFLKKLANHTLVKANNSLTIHLVGSDQIEKDYARQCLEVITNNPALNQIIQYHGQLAPFQLSSFFENANLFISTALMETYGMALQEARAFKLPILALEGGNIVNHITQGQNGFAFNNPTDLLEKLELFIKNPTQLAHLHRNIGAIKTDVYTWEVAAKSLLSQINNH